MTRSVLIVLTMNEEGQREVRLIFEIDGKVADEQHYTELDDVQIRSPSRWSSGLSGGE